jgi:predicted DNA-binding transcriptional regulator
MKKTGFVWFILVIGTADLLFGLFLLISQFTGSSGIQYTGNTMLGILGTLLEIIGFVISAIYIYKLYQMRTDIIKWTNISFGYSVFVLVFSSVGIVINTGNLVAAVISNLFTVIIMAVLWGLFCRHLKKLMSKSA